MVCSNRLAIYCFYDPQGIVDDYVIRYLEELRQNAKCVIVAVNGELQEDSRRKLAGVCEGIVLRPNEGYDGAAVREVLSSVGNLSEYDELVISNNSFFGPVYPLFEVFGEMSLRRESAEFDFWGITVHPEVKDTISDKQPVRGKANAHVQTYFVVLSNKVISSDAFGRFFAQMPKIETFYDAVGCYEMGLTYALEKAGFKYSSLIDPNRYPSENLSMYRPYELMTEDRMPFVKRKVFTEKCGLFLNESCGDEAKRVFDYIRYSTDYDEKLITQNLCRTGDPRTLSDNLQLCAVIGASEGSKTSSGNDDVQRRDLELRERVLVIMHVHYASNAEHCLDVLKGINARAKVIVTCSSDESYEMCLKIAERESVAVDEIIRRPNKGRDMSSYLVECRDKIRDSEFLCFLHDKSSPHAENRFKVMEWVRHCEDSLLDSSSYLAGVVSYFDENPHIGLLSPLPPDWGKFYDCECPQNANKTTSSFMTELLHKMGASFGLGEYHVAPYGDMFWCRSVAIKPLLDMNWRYEDFPEEPLASDGTLLHAVERILPYVCKKAGYMCGWTMNAKCAGGALLRKKYYADSLNALLLSNRVSTFKNLSNRLRHDSKMSGAAMSGLFGKRALKALGRQYAAKEFMFKILNALTFKKIVELGVAERKSRQRKEFFLSRF